MKSKIIVGAMLIALCAMGTSNESMAKGMKVKVSKQMPMRKQVKVKVVKTKYAYNNRNKREMLRQQPCMVWVPAHWEYNTNKKRTWRAGYYRRG